MIAFGHADVLLCRRQAVSSSVAQIQFLIGQDMKSVRGIEELRTGARRHESNIQLLTTQLGEFRLLVQDQMNNIRTHFSQTVNEFYQKIVERQNAMGYRLSSVVDELSAIKGKGNNSLVIAWWHRMTPDADVFAYPVFLLLPCLVRNIPLVATAGVNDQGGAVDNDDDDPLLSPPSLDSRWKTFLPTFSFYICFISYFFWYFFEFVFPPVFQPLVNIVVVLILTIRWQLTLSDGTHF